MKYQIPLLLLISLFLFSCSSKKEISGIIIDRIQYDVPINNNNPELFWWVNNIEGSKREAVLRTIYENAETGKVDAYDYFYNKLSLEEVRNVGIDTIYQTLMRTVEPYDEYDTVVIERITYSDVTRIRFLEEWVMDEKTLQVSKNVVGLAPIYERGYNNEMYTQVMFWVFFDDRYPNLLLNQ